MSDLLRQALADAPDGLHVGRDGFRDLALFADDHELAVDDGYTDHQATMRLIGLLLAAAPHLAELLDQRHMNPEHLMQVRRAITEAAQAMEAES